MSNVTKNFKAKRGLKCANGLVPSYEEQAAQMEAAAAAEARAKFAPPKKEGLLSRMFSRSNAAAPAPAPEKPAAPTITENISNRNAALKAAANYADGKVPTHVGPGIVEGPGGPREDKVPARLSDGEAVLPAKTVMALGGPEAVEALIEQTNDGRQPVRGLGRGKFADGTAGMWEKAKGMAGSAYDTMRGYASSAKNAAVGHGPGIEGISVKDASMDDFVRAGTNNMREAINNAASPRSATSGLRSAINGRHTATVGDLVESAGKVSSRVSTSVGNKLKGAGRAGPAIAGIEGAVRGYNTTNDEYAQRLNIDAPESALGGLALRTAGVMSDVGAAAIDGVAAIPNMIRHGLDTDKWWSYRDNFNDVAARKGMAAGRPAAPAGAAPTAKPGAAPAAGAAPAVAPVQQPLTPSQATPENADVTVARTMGAQGRYAGSGAIPTKDEGVMRTVGGADSGIVAGRDAKGQLVLTGGHEAAATKRGLSSGSNIMDEAIKNYGMAAPTMLRIALEDRGQQIAANNNRMGYMWKNMETQAERNNKLLDSQFGPAWDKDGKPNEVRQKIDKQFAATLAKFGIQHPGQVSDDQLQHFLAVSGIANDAQGGAIARGLGRLGIGEQPPVEYDSPYDTVEGMKRDPSLIGGGRWVMNGVPINPWTTSIDGSGGGINPFRPAANGTRERVLAAAKNNGGQ